MDLPGLIQTLETNYILLTNRSLKTAFTRITKKLQAEMRLAQQYSTMTKFCHNGNSYIVEL